MNPGLRDLRAYPFERLAAIRARIAPAGDRELINLSIGEPQHATPSLITDALIRALAGTARYPATRGLPELRQSIAAWSTRRFALEPGQLHIERQILPVNGTREALFSIAQCVVAAGSAKNVVAMPNPFYQIYEGATLLAGGEPYYLHCPAERGFRPSFADVSDEIWRRVALVYVCSPGNPSGAVLDAEDYRRLLQLADRHDFLVVADECYSELYFDEQSPPLGLLEWCARNGRPDFARCLVMHSLSKRSNAPGLRSGFVAGDARVMDEFYRYRTYLGGAMSLPVQHASIAAWNDETHVIANRARYRRKFQQVVPILAEVTRVTQPAAGFYLWPELGCDDIVACERLLGDAGVLTLPGSFLGATTASGNPGARRLRLALVTSEEECLEAARRMRTVLAQLNGV